MAVEHPNAALIRELYDARARGDRAAMYALFAEDVAWHDFYPPPHGGELVGRDSVFRDIFDTGAALTNGTLRLWLHGVIADDDMAVAMVYWSATYRNRTMESKETVIYRIHEERIVEAWMYPFDQAAADDFFG